MQCLLCITVFIAVISGVMSRSTLHSSPRYRGPYFSRPQNNAISSYRPPGRNVLCRYGAYKRDCCYGWKRNEVGTCTPICEKPCVHGVCVGPNRCKCESGWTGPTCSQDYNECSVRPCDHRCMNTPGSYRCYCDHGYILLSDGSTCSRDDRCYSTRCAFGCVQYDDGFNCFCPDGLRITADGLGCEDVDECEEGIATCPRGRRCSNTYGNYLCLCQEGYKFQYVNGKLTCVDDDECKANADKCDVNANCENLSGGYRCVCKAGYVGTGEKCLEIGLTTCTDKPCFEGVKCTNARIDVNNLDYENGGVAERYQCGACPVGFSGDGQDCVATNVDVTILVVDESNAPVHDARITALDIRSGGATEFGTAFSGINGVAKLPVPNDASIVVVASKDTYTTTSTTYDVQSDESNMVSLTLAAYKESARFTHPLPIDRTFSFADPNTPGGQLQVQIPSGGLDAPTGETIQLEVRTVDVTDPQAARSVPEMAALVTEGEAGRVEAHAIADVKLYDSEKQKVGLTDTATIRIPVSERFDSVSAGDQVPAWYFNEAIGLWVPDGTGTIEEDGQGGLVWVYETEHFSWFMAGYAVPSTRPVTIKTCFTTDCSTVAPHAGISVWGMSYYGHASETSNSAGVVDSDIKIPSLIQVIDSCSDHTEEYTISLDTTEITFKLPDTANQGCRDPGQVQNGVRKGNSLTYGSEVTYYCDPDYKLHGSTRRVCGACGEWSGYQPYCEQDEVLISSSLSSSFDQSSVASSPAEIYGSGDSDAGFI